MDKKIDQMRVMATVSPVKPRGRNTNNKPQLGALGITQMATVSPQKPLKVFLNIYIELYRI